MKFIYQAKTKQGEIRSGTVEASSLKAALSVLQKHNLRIIALESVEPRTILEKKITIFQRISRKDIVIFSRQLAIMFKSNVSLAEALEIAAKQQEKDIFKEKILNLSKEIKGGIPFSQALSKHPKLFSSFYVSMIKSGEASGSLAESLDYLADHLEREYNLRSSIIGAMIYPALVVCVMFAVLIVMMVFVIPNLTGMLQSTGQELPFVTKLIINISDFLRIRGWILLIAVIGFGFLFYQFSKSRKGSTFLDKMFLKLPMIGKFIKMIQLSTFAENLSTLISGGLPIAQALDISGDIVSNNIYKKIIKISRDEVKKGESISSTFLRYPKVFPPMFCQMILVGEKTGNLDKTLMNIVNFYQKEVNRAIKAMLSILEPLLVVFLGLIVAGIMAAVMLPMYQMMGI